VISQTLDLFRVGDVGSEGIDAEFGRRGRQRRPSRSEITTRIPAAAKRCAIALPIPDAPPVMTATRPSRSGSAYPFLNRAGVSSCGSCVMWFLPERSGRCVVWFGRPPPVMGSRTWVVPTGGPVEVGDRRSVSTMCCSFT
jgi:hypothetical protein